MCTIKLKCIVLSIDHYGYLALYPKIIDTCIMHWLCTVKGIMLLPCQCISLLVLLTLPLLNSYLNGTIYILMDIFQKSPAFFKTNSHNYFQTRMMTWKHTARLWCHCKTSIWHVHLYCCVTGFISHFHSQIFAMEITFMYLLLNVVCIRINCLCYHKIYLRIHQESPTTAWLSRITKHYLYRAKCCCKFTCQQKGCPHVMMANFVPWVAQMWPCKNQARTMYGSTI